MKKTELEAWLTAVARGERPVAEAMAALSGIPTASLGFADVDQARSVRCGFPEVVFGAGKTPEQVRDIATEIVRAHGRLLATRLEPEALASLADAFPDGDAHADAALFRLDRSPAPPIGAVSVLSAGTSDQRVAEEAVHTAEAMGAAVTRVYDVGVAGVHRLFDRRADFIEANALVVVAGMEGRCPRSWAGSWTVPSSPSRRASDTAPPWAGSRRSSACSRAVRPGSRS